MAEPAFNLWYTQCNSWQVITGFAWYISRRPCYGLAVYYLTDWIREKNNMEVQLFIGNLSKSTTQEELFNLFVRAGEVLRVDLITDQKSGASKGYAFITMSAQSEADKAVSMFNLYPLDEHSLKVFLAKPRGQRGFSNGS